MSKLLFAFLLLVLVDRAFLHDEADVFQDMDVGQRGPARDAPARNAQAKSHDSLVLITLKPRPTTVAHDTPP
jgi:hypothetical protein